MVAGKKSKVSSRFFLAALGLLINGFCIAQTAAQSGGDKTVQMADGLRSSGKIYVVVAVLLTVLTGLFIYLVRLDKKIAKLEKG